MLAFQLYFDEASYYIHVPSSVRKISITSTPSTATTPQSRWALEYLPPKNQCWSHYEIVLTDDFNTVFFLVSHGLLMRHLSEALSKWVARLDKFLVLQVSGPRYGQITGGNFRKVHYFHIKRACRWDAGLVGNPLDRIRHPWPPCLEEATGMEYRRWNRSRRNTDTAEDTMENAAIKSSVPQRTDDERSDKWGKS